MTNETPAVAAVPGITRGSVVLVWTLIARSLGLAAGIALGLLLMAAIVGAF